MSKEKTKTVTKFTADCLLYVIKGIISTYDLISWPVYFINQGVSKKQRDVSRVRSKQADPSDPNSPWRQIDIEPRQQEIENKIDSYKTYDEMMAASFRANAESPCYGYRQILDEIWIKRPDGGDRLLRQVRLGPYRWCSYAQFDAQIEAARKGFLRDGVRAGQKVILFADTRAEWQIVSQALLRLGAVLCTMYSTLGIDGIIHTCNETKAQLVVSQRDKIERLLKLQDELPHLKKIIYFDQSLHLPSKLGGNLDDDKYIEENNEDLESNNNDTKPTFVGQLEALERGLECMSFVKLLQIGLNKQPKRQLKKHKKVNNSENNEDNNVEQKENNLVNEDDDDDEEKIERENAKLLSTRTKDSLAVIMYTSGSTGIPKGVLISHGNIMATIKSFSYVTKDFVHNPKENICTAYLPLAHIFEFCIESVMLYHGVRYGFATPHTLTDKSPGLVPGEKGDLGQLRPTVMIIVPLILDRVVQGVKQALKADSYFKGQFVSYLIDYKSYWQKRQYETPLVDRIVCNKIAAALGGRAKWVICGSAPLSSQTQTFVRAALNLKLPQGFGTTETCAATACQLFNDQSTQNVGLPVAGAQIKLEPWLEGNYRPTDKPNPRGEIVVGGQMIAHGYFNLEEQTEEAFYVDDKGVRWYRTGDIGEFLPNGQLKIIDRKKDLVKLQNGEYISLGRIESTLKSNPFTDNFCIYANSNHNHVVALGPANMLAIKQLAQQLVDQFDRALSLSPASAKRQGLPDSRQERQDLLLNNADNEQALMELRDLLATYESDLLNNNADDSSLSKTKLKSNNNNINSNSNSNLTSKNSFTTKSAKCQIQNNNNNNNAASGVDSRTAKFCSNKLILDHIMGHICKMAKERKLLTLEVPKKLLLIPEEWTEDKNLVTAAMKIRRNFIYKRYEQELAAMYATDEA